LLQPGGWQAGFMPRTSHRPAQPAVLVMERQPLLAAALAELSDYLNIRLHAVADADALAGALLAALPSIQAAGVLARTGASEGCRMLRLVSAFDRFMPVLLMAADDDDTPCVALDDTAALCGMTAVTRRDARPETTELVEFLFRAGRHGGAGRMLPVR
jgi:hypothetical protein